MDPSSSTAVIALASESIGGHTSKVDSNISQPGDRIVVNENTFIIEADGGIIPIPAGTVATLLPDSDDETAQEKEPMANSCESDFRGQDVTINRPSGSNSPPKSEISTVEDSGLCETNSKLPLLAQSVEAVSHDDAANATVTMNKECSAAISDKIAENSVPSDESMKNHDVVEETTLVPASASIAMSDLYVQEEEEVIMDDVSTDVAAVSNTLRTVNSPSVSISASKSDSEESTHSKNCKKVAAKKSVKKAHAPEGKAEVSETVSAKSVVKDGVTNVQHNLLEKIKSMSPPVPAISASGRPQRSTPRRSAIDLLKGTDAVKPARRSAVADAESEGPAAKVPKISVLKKNAEATSISTPVEEKTISDATPSRGRPRRKVVDVNSPVIERGSDAVTTSNDEFSKSVDNKLFDSAAVSSEEVKNEVNSYDYDEENPNLFKNKNSLVDHNMIGMETDCQSNDNCKTGNTNGSVAEQAMLHESNKKTPKKTDHDHRASVVSIDDSGAASSVQRGRQKRSTACVDTDQKDQPLGKVSSKPYTVKFNPEQDGSQHRSTVVESDLHIADGSTQINQVVCHNDDVGKRPCVGHSTKTSSLPGFPYHSFTMVTAGKKIAEVKSRTKNMKACHRKEKLVNQIGASKESHKYALNMSQDKLPNIESMQARIRELEAQVERLQIKLDEIGKPDGVRSVDKSKVPNSFAKGLSIVSPDLDTDEKSRLARWEEKLRKLDMELDEKRTELIIRLGCITRYERQVLEKERRLKRLELNLTLRKQSTGNVDDAPKDVVTVTDVPLLMTGRVDLHAEEHKLELRRQELERQKSFLEDEKKKLVAKERELETREQAAMDADLMSMASVFKTSDASLPVHSLVKQSNGKVEVEFSDDDDGDGFGAETQQFGSALADTVRLPTPNAFFEDDDLSGRDEDTSFPQIESSNKKPKKTHPTGDSSVQLTSTTSDLLCTKSPSKRRHAETEDDRSKPRK